MLSFFFSATSSFALTKSNQSSMPLGKRKLARNSNLLDDVSSIPTKVRLYTWNHTSEDILMSDSPTEVCKWAKLTIINSQKEISEDDKRYYENYNASLSHLRLKYPLEECIAYINRLHENKNTHKYHHCISNLCSFDTKKLIITKIDEQNRIYHYLTNLKKELKPLYNIKHQLDIANSHPLLLNKILIGEYKINKEELN